jgi:hypothetical protein
MSPTAILWPILAMFRETGPFAANSFVGIRREAGGV